MVLYNWCNRCIVFPARSLEGSINRDENRWCFIGDPRPKTTGLIGGFRIRNGWCVSTKTRLRPHNSTYDYTILQISSIPTLPAIHVSLVYVCLTNPATLSTAEKWQAKIEGQSCYLSCESTKNNNTEVIYYVSGMRNLQPVVNSPSEPSAAQCEANVKTTRCVSVEYKS